MKNLADRILSQEEFGRAIYLQHHTGMQWITNNERYGVWDVSGTTGEHTPFNVLDMYVEVKARNIKSTDFDTTFLEVKKCKALLLQAQKSTNKGKAFYFVTFTDGVSFLFDLTKLAKKTFKGKKQYMPAFTFENPNGYVEKDVIELPLTAASKIYKN